MSLPAPYSLGLSLMVQLAIDEMTTRERFIGEYGGYLPDDLCPYVADLPARWLVESEGTDGAALLEESVVEEVRALCAPMSSMILIMDGDRPTRISG